MIHTEGRHFAVDANGDLVEYTGGLTQETQASGIVESGNRYDNRMGRKLSTLRLRDDNPHFIDDNGYYPPGYFTRNADEPFPGTLGNVWIEADGLGGFQASGYGFSRGWTQDDIDTKNYFFYLYDDQGLRPDRAAQRVVLLPPGGCDLERIEPLAGAPDVVMRNCIRERRLECSIEQIFGPGASA